MLKKKNWFIVLILNVLTLGLFNFALAFKLDLYKEDEWYNKWQYWFFASLCLIIPVFVLLIIFLIEMIVRIAVKLKVDGENIYASPYSWIICVIVPVIGWALLITMLLYIMIFTVVALKEGKGEVYA